ncbi:hypothetical protein [Paracidovorax anthurii]|uniref:hypothetical protein n=1 Tax=Paracidovorax anthurii TaxID=78229 RepID=UPI0039EE6019
MTAIKTNLCENFRFPIQAVIYLQLLVNMPSTLHTASDGQNVESNAPKMGKRPTTGRACTNFRLSLAILDAGQGPTLRETRPNGILLVAFMRLRK